MTAGDLPISVICYTLHISKLNKYTKIRCSVFYGRLETLVNFFIILRNPKDCSGSQVVMDKSLRLTFLDHPVQLFIYTTTNIIRVSYSLWIFRGHWRRYWPWSARRCTSGSMRVCDDRGRSDIHLTASRHSMATPSRVMANYLQPSSVNITLNNWQ